MSLLLHEGIQSSSGRLILPSRVISAPCIPPPDKRVKVSLFLQEGIQSSSGRLILPSPSSSSVGTVVYMDASGAVASREKLAIKRPAVGWCGLLERFNMLGVHVLGLDVLSLGQGGSLGLEWSHNLEGSYESHGHRMFNVMSLGQEKAPTASFPHTLVHGVTPGTPLRLPTPCPYALSHPGCSTLMTLGISS